MNGPLPRWLNPLAVPASWLYAAEVARRNRAFDRGRGVRSIDRPVISVGNITTGGTGKTPFTVHLVRRLIERGHQPAIAMRGYRAARDRAGDEESEYAERIPGVPVIAHPHRFEALQRFLPDHQEVDVILLDDGFQHRQLKRDLDLVLIDATQDTFAQRVLPAGHLREPLKNLKRADAVVVTRADRVDEALTARIEAAHGNRPVAWTCHAWRDLCVWDESGSRREPVEWLAGRRVVTLLGVGNPRSVRAQIQGHGGEIVRELPAHDHQHYDRVFAARICAATDDAVLLTTLKDWVKLREVLDLADLPLPVVVPTLEVRFLAGEAELFDRLECVFG